MATNGKTVALITGANKGLGFETARQLGHKGIAVVVGARDLRKAEDASAKLRAEKIDARALKLDVTEPTDHAAAAKFLDQNFGKLDILVNNAGIMVGDPFGNTTINTTQENLRQTFDTNFFAPVALTQALLPLLKKSAAGRVVNLSSILGSLTLHADPNSPIYASKNLAYSASKAALNMFTTHLAHALRETKIKVNSVHPGWVKTDMGTDAAPMEIVDGAKTSVDLATEPADGPNSAFIHMGQPLPW